MAEIVAETGARRSPPAVRLRRPRFAEPETGAETESESVAVAESVSENVGGTGTESGAEAESECEAETGSECEAEPATEAASEAASVAASVAESGSECEAESEAECAKVVPGQRENGAIPGAWSCSVACRMDASASCAKARRCGAKRCSAAISTSEQKSS